MKLIIFCLIQLLVAIKAKRIYIKNQTLEADEPFTHSEYKDGDIYVDVQKVNGKIGEKTFLNFKTVEQLHFFDADLEEIDFTGFQAMPKLKVLILNEVRGPIKMTNQNLRKMPNLELLYLFVKKEYLKDINSSVFDYTNLKDIVVENMKIDMLTGLDNLLALGLWGCEIVSEDIFSGVPNLENLEFKASILPLKRGFFRQLKKLQILRLPNINNGLEELKWEYFEGLDSLKELVLDVNHIQKINHPSVDMQPLKNLEKIGLSLNKINQIDWNFLKLFPNLQSLDLSSNEIKKVGNETITPGGQNLKRLNFDTNNIKRFNWDFLKNFPNLEVLKLQNNKLVHINGQKIREYLPKLEFISLYGQKSLTCKYLEEVSTEIRKDNGNITVKVTKFQSSKYFKNTDCLK